MTTVHAGATLRQLRMVSGLSLRQLARRVGVSSTYLSRVEHGHDSAPSPDRLRDIANALGIPLTLLTELTEGLPSPAADYMRSTPGASALLLELARRRPPPTVLVRLRAVLEQECPSPAEIPERRVSLSDLLSRERLVLKLSCQHIEDALDVGTARLAAGASPELARLLGERMRANERQGAAIGGGMAVFRALQPGMSLRAALVTLARPLPIHTPDRAPLKALLLLTGPDAHTGLVEAIAQAALLTRYGVVEAIWPCLDGQVILQRLAELESLVGS